MKIYLADLNTFDINILKDFSLKSDFKNLKEKQHYLGLYLVNYVCKHFYNLKRPEIKYISDKPFIKNADIFISISHSKNLVAVGFDKNDIGIDIEYNLKKRNFVEIIARYKDEFMFDNFENLSTEEQRIKFYEFWTIHEAKIKLNKDKIFTFTTNEINDFTLSAVSANEVNNVEIIKIN